VTELFPEFGRLDGLDDLPQALLDAPATLLQVLHLPGVGASGQST